MTKTPMLLLALSLAACSKREAAPPPSAEASLTDVTASPNRIVKAAGATVKLTHSSVTPLVRATGVVTVDPRSVNTISSRFDGRIERLALHYNFQPIGTGAEILAIYSPAILAEQERLIALTRGNAQASELAEAAKQKLANLGLTDAQIARIVSSRQPINPLPVYSPYGGHIHDVVSRTTSTKMNASGGDGMASMIGGTSSTSAAPSDYATNLASSELSLKEGMYVRAGQALVSVYDASRVWIALNIPRSEAALVHHGDAVTIRPETDREHPITAKIDYIEPILDASSSSLRARVYLEGVSHESSLKIGALVDAMIEPSAVDGAWLPKSAVVSLGKRDVVFVKRDGRFAAVEIRTGIATDSLVQISSGVDDSDEVALEAHYFVDSDSFIRTEAAQ
ncbi:MAG: efflux RND transporter periplasmic adaptor subunit [Bacteroidetes bacterium]|nr:efflux RND transporter periplasmic adaptor subunit [Bacteroidota bacterium]